MASAAFQNAFKNLQPMMAQMSQSQKQRSPSGPSGPSGWVVPAEPAPAAAMPMMAPPQDAQSQKMASMQLTIKILGGISVLMTFLFIIMCIVVASKNKKK